MGEIIGIVSGKGGVGKTTLCANLAFALAMRGKNVIAIDGDIGLKNLDILLGMVDKTAFDLTDILSGRCMIGKAIQVHDNYPNLHFISASQTADAGDIDKATFRKLCIYLRARYDYVLIDAPAGVGVGFGNIVASCDTCVVVATPDLTAIRDAQKTATILAGVPGVTAKLVINRVSPKMITKGYLRNIDDIMDSISLPLVGLVPADDRLIVYSNSGVPAVGSKSICSGPFFNIADRLDGIPAPLDNYWRK